MRKDIRGKMIEFSYARAAITARIYNCTDLHRFAQIPLKATTVPLPNSFPPHF